MYSELNRTVAVVVVVTIAQDVYMYVNCECECVCIDQFINCTQLVHAAATCARVSCAC